MLFTPLGAGETSEIEEVKVIQMVTDVLQEMVTDVLQEMVTVGRFESISRIIMNVSYYSGSKCLYETDGHPRYLADEAIRAFYQVRHELSLWGRDLVCLARGQRAVIPTSLQERILDVAHEGHLGLSRVKQRCREAVWWPRIDRHIEERVRACEACQLSGESLKPREAPLQPVPWSSQPWKKIQIDIFGEVVAAPSSQRFMVVVHDLHSKWPEVRAFPRVTSDVAISYLQELFARWGLPKSVISDNGPQFSSYEFEEFLRRQGIQHIKITHKGTGVWNGSMPS